MLRATAAAFDGIEREEEEDNEGISSLSLRLPNELRVKMGDVVVTQEK